MDDLLWYLEITLDYIKQMLPCMAIAAGCFLALLHHRRRGLYRRGLQSGVVREIGLLAFVLFCAGLAALMGHRAMTVCCIIAGRVAKDMNTSYQDSLSELIITVLERF